MSNQYFNFYYSPQRQGFDSSSWRALFGLPIASNGELLMSNTAIVHYADLLRADAVFNFNTPAPSGGLSKKFGFLQPNKNCFAYFHISGNTLLATCSNGTTTTTEAITWETYWTNTDTEFRVQWEAGTATFYVGGIQKAVIQDITVPGDPMSIYIANEADDVLILNYIDVKTIQSYLMNEGQENAVFNEFYVYGSDQVAVTDVITMFLTILNVNILDGVSDGLSTTENVNVSIFYPISVVDSLTLTDVDTVGDPA